MHISDYMFQRLNGHLQAVYIHKQKNYILKYHFIWLDFLKVFWYAFYNTKICDLSLTPYNGAVSVILVFMYLNTLKMTM
jgi:hypothetical protein